MAWAQIWYLFVCEASNVIHRLSYQRNRESAVDCTVQSLR